MPGVAAVPVGPYRGKAGHSPPEHRGNDLGYGRPWSYFAVVSNTIPSGARNAIRK